MPLEMPRLNRLVDARRADAAMPHSMRHLRARDDGSLVRLRPGIYCGSRPPLGRLESTERYNEERLRYLDEALAVGLTREARVVFSHDTAQAIWNLPRFGGWPRDVHILEKPESERRSANRVRVHRQAAAARDVQRWGDFLVTSPSRTLADLIRSSSPIQSVAALDRVLNHELSDPDLQLTKDNITAVLAESPSSRGMALARDALAFSDGASGSPGESASRVVMRRLGFPACRLQVRHPSPIAGTLYFRTDFEWPERKLIGEFDGAGKYLKPEYLKGREPGEVVVEEKRREDALRAEGYAVVRWGWDEVRRPWLLHALLSRAGLPTSVRAVPHVLSW